MTDINYREGFRQILKSKKESEKVVVETPVEDVKIIPVVEDDFIPVEDPLRPPVDNKIVLVPEPEGVITIVNDPVLPIQIIPDPDQFVTLELTEGDLNSIKSVAYSDLKDKELTVSELVDLVLLAKSNKPVKENNKEGLLIRELVDIRGKITKTGKIYLELDETKTRLIKLLNANK